MNKEKSNKVICNICNFSSSNAYYYNMRKKATEAESRELLLDVFLLIGCGSCNVSTHRWGIFSFRFI